MRRKAWHENPEFCEQVARKLGAPVEKVKEIMKAFYEWEEKEKAEARAKRRKAPQKEQNA